MLGKGSFCQRVLQIIRLYTLVDIIKVPKVHTSGEWLPIDTNFVSILLLVSVLFSPIIKAQISEKLVTIWYK